MTSSDTVARNGNSLPAQTPQPLDRRSFMAKAGSALALVTTALPAVATEADPIFAAIDAHKRATLAFRSTIDIHSQLDQDLPADKCRSCVTAWEEKIVETDDPRWIEAERGMIRTSDAQDDAATALINIVPTTFGGVMALLNYAVEPATTDHEIWPDLLPDEHAKRVRPWHHFLIANLAEVLPGMVRSA